MRRISPALLSSALAAVLLCAACGNPANGQAQSQDSPVGTGSDPVLSISGETLNGLSVSVTENEGSYLIRASFGHEPKAKEVNLVREFASSLLKSRKVNERGVAISAPFADRDSLIMTITPKTSTTDDGLNVMLPPLTFTEVKAIAREGDAVVFRVTLGKVVGRKGLTAQTLREEAQTILFPYVKQLKLVSNRLDSVDLTNATLKMGEVSADLNWIEYSVADSRYWSMVERANSSLPKVEADRFGRLSDLLDRRNPN